MNLGDHIEAALQATSLWHVRIFVSGGLVTKLATHLRWTPSVGQELG